MLTRSSGSPMITFGRFTKLSSLFVAIFWVSTGKIWKRLPCQSSSMQSPVVAISASRVSRYSGNLSMVMGFILKKLRITNYELGITN